MRPRETLGLNERGTLAGPLQLRHGGLFAAMLLLLAPAVRPLAQDAGTSPPVPAPTGTAPAGVAAGTSPPVPAPTGTAPSPLPAPAGADPSVTAATDAASGTVEADREAEVRAASDLSRGRRSGEVVRLAVEGTEVLALWRPGEAAERRGGVVLLHAVPGSLDDPAVAGALRRALPASGFSTLSVALPVPAAGVAPLGSPPWQEPVQARLAAAFNWMLENDGPVHALIGHGASAAHVKRLVDVATGRPEGLRAVVLIDAGPGLQPAEAAWMHQLPVPVLDVVPGRVGEDPLRPAGQRLHSARRLGGAEYRSVAMSGVGPDWYPARQRLIAAVRGFLLRHAAGPEEGGD